MLEGTHDDRAAGDNTRHSHRRVPLSYYATALCAPGVANNTAQSLVLFVKLDARYGRRLATPILSSKLHIPLISRLRTSFDGAIGLVYDEFGAHRLAALRLVFRLRKGKFRV